MANATFKVTSTGNTIEAPDDEVFMNATYPGDYTLVTAPNTPDIPPVYLWYLDVGDFFDRFGDLQLAVLMNTDPAAQAMIKNISARKWVDLQRADVIAAVNYLAGATLPGVGTITVPIAGMTSALATTVLTTQPTDKEQLTLVKLYFS